MERKNCSGRSNLCASDTMETFRRLEETAKRYFVRNKQLDCKQSSCRGSAVTKSAPVSVKKPPAEQVVLKYGKIRVTVKNAKEVKTVEEDGMMVIKLK